MQIVTNGIISGVSIAVLAAAFQCVYLPTRVFFIGLAGLYALTPFVAWSAIQAGLGPIAAVVASIIVAVAASVLCEWLIHHPLNRKKASSGAQLIASLGASMIMVQVTAIIWGNQTRSLRTQLDAVFHLGPIVVTGAQCVTLCAGLSLVLAFWLLLMRSDLGLRLRALSDNPSQFALLGYNVYVYRTLSFVAGGVLAAGASLITAYDIGFDPHSGLHAVLLAVVAVIIGGRTSFIGPIVGGILLGVIRAGVVWHFSARWQEAVTFALLAMALLLLPQGLFSNKTRLEAIE